MNSPAVARGRMIETRHVAKKFGQTSALRDASLCVAQGEIPNLGIRLPAHIRQGTIHRLICPFLDGAQLG